MMDYEIYKELVLEQIRDYLPPEYETAKIWTDQVTKVNHVKDALMIRLEDEEPSVIPTLYLEDMYEFYQEKQDFSLSIKWAVNMYMEAKKDSPDIDQILDIEQSKENIYFQLINREQNEGLLEKLPNRPFEDLAIVYRLNVDAPNGMQGSALVTHAFAEQLKLSEEDLFILAMENTKRLYPVSIRKMEDVIADMMKGSGMPEEMMGDITVDSGMYVISNMSGMYGAASILYEDKLFELAEQLGDNLYILPSSVHEVIAIKESMGKLEELAVMVSEINRDVLDPKEVLSDQVYHYDKALRKVFLATGTPDRAIDSKDVKTPDAVTR